MVTVNMGCELERHVRTYFLILSDCFCYVSISFDAQLNDAVCKTFITISSNKITFKCVSVREHVMYKMMKTSANAFQYNKLNFTHNRVESQESSVKKLREKSNEIGTPENAYSSYGNENTLTLTEPITLSSHCLFANAKEVPSQENAIWN